MLSAGKSQSILEKLDNVLISTANISCLDALDTLLSTLKLIITSENSDLPQHIMKASATDILEQHVREVHSGKLEVPTAWY